MAWADALVTSDASRISTSAWAATSAHPRILLPLLTAALGP
jgi:hypothetical protein